MHVNGSMNMSKTRNQRMNKNSQKSSKEINKTSGKSQRLRHNDGTVYNSKRREIILSIAFVTLILLSTYIIFVDHDLTGQFDLKGNTRQNSFPTSIGAFSKVSNTPNIVNGKIPVLFVGSMACPYCAQVSWTIYSALNSLGGKWSGLSYDYSNLTDRYPDTPGLSFANASLSSSIVVFHGYETSNRNWQPYQKLNTTDDALFNRYDPAGHIPFILIGGVYLHIGETFSPSILANLSGSNILGSLVNNSSYGFVSAIHNESAVIKEVVNYLHKSLKQRGELNVNSLINVLNGGFAEKSETK